MRLSHHVISFAKSYFLLTIYSTMPDQYSMDVRDHKTLKLVNKIEEDIFLQMFLRADSQIMLKTPKAGGHSTFRKNIFSWINCIEKFKYNVD